MQHVETICDTFGGGWQFGSASRDAGHPGANLLLPMLYIYDAWPVVQPGKIVTHTVGDGSLGVHREMRAIQEQICSFLCYTYMMLGRLSSRARL